MHETAIREKQERAKAIVEEIKVEKDKVNSQDDADRLTAKMTEARSLMAEVQTLKAEDTQARANELIELAEKQQASAGGEVKKPGPIVGNEVKPPVVDAFRDRMTSKQRLVVPSDSMASLKAKGFDILTAAIGEGTGAAGGFLVVPSYMQDLFAETRRQGNALRALRWLNIHPVESNLVYIPKGAGAASVGIVAESATKPSADQTFTQVSVNIFTWAGISKHSKQMVMDSQPTVLDLSARELGTLLGNLEEQKIYNGSGTGEPRGILNTTGLAIVPQSASDTAAGAVAAAATAQTIIDRILDAVVQVNTQYFAPPNGAMMHPRRLGFLLKAKDTSTNYLFNVRGTFRGPNLGPMVDGVTSQSEGTTDPVADLFGLPIGISANIPTTANYGVTGASDQDVVVVGAWQEAHWFQRQDITLDTSDTAGTSWEQNQVWLRLEERAGFSAERYPTAFAVVHGKGLAATNT